MSHGFFHKPNLTTKAESKYDENHISKSDLSCRPFLHFADVLAVSRCLSITPSKHFAALHHPNKWGFNCSFTGEEQGFSGHFLDFFKTRLQEVIVASLHTETFSMVSDVCILGLRGSHWYTEWKWCWNTASGGAWGLYVCLTLPLWQTQSVLRKPLPHRSEEDSSQRK